MQPWSVFEMEKNISYDSLVSNFLEAGIVASPDPRFSSLGIRVLASRSKVPEILLQNSVKKDLFKALRHRQVIGNSKNNFFD
jgi:hypothetical protein